MNRQRALDLLTRSKPELQARFGVTRLALFGSTARDTATNGIDDDTLWSIIRDDVPELLPLLKALKDEAQS